MSPKNTFLGFFYSSLLNLNPLTPLWSHLVHTMTSTKQFLSANPMSNWCKEERKKYQLVFMSNKQDNKNIFGSYLATSPKKKKEKKNPR